MSRSRFGNAILTWTDSNHTGTHRSHPLRARFQRMRAAARVSKWEATSLNLANRETITAGQGVAEAVVSIRWDDLPQSLTEVMLAGAQGQTFTYYPDANTPSVSWDIIVVGDTAQQAAALESIQGLFGEATIDLRVRRSDGSRFGDEFFTDLLFYYRAGQDLNAATFSRSSTARYKHADRTLSEAASGAVRDGHFVEGSDGIWVPSTLLEGARTNELTRSEDLTHADWAANNLSARNANQATDPEGGSGLDELVEDGTTAAHNIEQSLTGMTANATYAFSVWAIANTRTILELRLDGAVSSSNYARAWFDLSDGTVGTTGAGGTGSFTRAYVEDYTDVAAGLYRCVLVGSVGDGETGIDAKVILSTADGTESYAGDGSSSLYVGWAQVEDDVGSASSYIPTTTASDTRNADTLHFDTSLTPQESTFYVKFVERGTIHHTSARILHLGAAGGFTDPRFTIEQNSGNYRVVHDDGGAGVAAAATASPSVGDTVEIRAALNSDGSVTIGQSINGGAETTATSGSAAALQADWADQRLYLGSGGTSDRGFNAFIGLTIAKGVKTMADMRSLARN